MKRLVDVFTSEKETANIYSDSEIPSVFERLKKRTSKDISGFVKEILNELDSEGFEKIVELTEKYDDFKLNSENVKINSEEIEKQIEKLTLEQKQAIDEAFNLVYSFQAKIFQNIKTISSESNKGITKLVPKPIEKIGIYVPGGLAPLPSSLMMAAVTAMAAGVKEIVITTPPRKEGLNPAIAYLVKKLGVTEIYRIGGIQGIWYLSKRVDKVCGPGNSYVAEAKKQLAMQGKIGIDLTAGPSEVLILADETANPKFIAADMLAQAEHGITSPGILITDSEKIAKEVQNEIEIQLKKLKRKEEISSAIRDYGGILLVENISKGIEYADKYSSEHLELFLSEENLEKIKEMPSAGAIFINTGESFADYGFTGGNHILPTGGTARFSSGLSVYDFIIWQYQEELSAKEQEEMAELTGKFADLEGLKAHSNAARIRKRWKI